MRESVFDDGVRERIQRRIAQLGPDARRQFGRMDARQMVCHLADQLRVALGEIAAQPMPVPWMMRHTPVKQLVIDVIPWPKGRIQAPPEVFTTVPADWKRDVATLRDLLERFASHADDRMWPPHPIFGEMTGPLWGRLTRRHFDHHLKQFGV
jgi:hypothetical protein